jgi:hypothetical protein
MPAIPVDWVVENKRIILRNGGRGGGKEQRVADSKKHKKSV